MRNVRRDVCKCAFVGVGVGVSMLVVAGCASEREEREVKGGGVAFP